MTDKTRNELLRRTRRWLIAGILLIAPSMGFAQTYVSVAIAPPALPVYVQPAIPGSGYIWTPGYWGYGGAGYYWVPGTWVLPPVVGVLWTPGYWGWRNGFYFWNGGYWGPRVGYYGGINYGYGYHGVGYVGGYWNNGAFYYNRAVNNVNVNVVHNTYNTAVVNNTHASRVSYYGGTGGTRVEPTAQDRLAMNERHVDASEAQLHHEQLAAGNHAMLASENHGRPTIAATPQPGAFDHPGATPARNAARSNVASATNPGAAATGQAQHAHKTAGTGATQAHPSGQPQGNPHAHAEAPGHANGEPHGEGSHR